MAALVNNTQTDLWVVDEKTTNVNALGQLDLRLGREIESLPGVVKAYQYVLAGGSARFQSGKSAGVQLVGSEAPGFIGGPWNLTTGTTTDLLSDGAVTADYFDRKTMGGAKLGEDFEVGGKRVFIAAQTRGARGFGAVYLFTTLERARMLGKFPTNRVSAFLIKLAPNANAEEVKTLINNTIPGVRAWLPKEFAWATIITILSSSGIAISTGTMLVFAVISGLVIVGLTLYSSAVDRIKDYATMKAIGATNGFITRLILTQATMIAIIGCGIGTVLMEGFRVGVANGGAIFFYPLWLRFVFFGITLLLAYSGAWFAIRRIAKTEPAAVFRM